MSWPWEVVERDHDIQNPLSVDKIRLLGEYLRLEAGNSVLDVACGKGAPARILAATFGCRVLGIELRPAFADEARARLAASGMDELVTVETADAAERPLEPEAYDAALCFGAAFVWGNVGDAAAALVPAVKPGGGVAIGEPFWRRPPSDCDEQGYVDLRATVARFEEHGLALTGLIASSEDDWDRYRSLHWRVIEEVGGTEEIREQHLGRRDDYLRFERERLGWAVFVGRKR